MQQTYELASDHDGDPGWAEIRDHVQRVLDQITDDADDPTTEALGAQRLNRTVDIDEEQAQLAAAAMVALHDRPEPEQLELARAAIEQLDEAIG